MAGKDVIIEITTLAILQRAKLLQKFFRKRGGQYEGCKIKHTY